MWNKRNKMERKNDAFVYIFISQKKKEKKKEWNSYRTT